jgi:hypothetical protein
MDVSMLVNGRLSKSAAGSWVASATPLPVIDSPASDTEPLFEDDQRPNDEPRRPGAGYVPPGPFGFLRSALCWLLVLVMPWLSEILGTTTFLTFLLVIIRRRSWRRLGLGGGVEALNIFTGIVIGFFMGLVIWHALPDEIRYGGVANSTPLWLYLFLPASLAAFGAIASHLGLGRLWGRLAGLGAKPRLAIVGTQVLFCVAVLRVIIACVL